MKACRLLIPYIFDMKKYTLTSGLSLDGETYNAGDKVALTDEQAIELADIIDHTPTLDETPDETPVETGKSIKKMNVEELTGYMQANGIEFDPNGTKKEFIALIEAQTASAPVEPVDPETKDPE